jgi:hypothetical protein
MQTQASQQHNQAGRIAGIGMVMSCAGVIATLLIWAPSSIGSANRHLPQVVARAVCTVADMMPG